MFVFHGTLVHSSQQQPLEILQDHIIGIENGQIIFIEPGADLKTLSRTYGFRIDDVSTLSDSEFLMPGFIDTHIHAPQYGYAGTGLDLPLLKWLEKYTYPFESRYYDIAFAEEVYRKTVRKVLQNGTTTAVYFATIHLEASVKLCQIIEEYGQRAYVGKVNMDWNSPDSYRETTNESYENTERFIRLVLAKQNPLLTPVITPRFVPSVTPALLAQLGSLAEKYNIPIQSHICETKPEIEWVRKLYPKFSSYTDILKEHGLLTNKTIMAHGIYLTDDQLEDFKRAGTGISHCPNSNLSLCSGMLDARHVKELGVKLGLGTDVAGGYSPSILNAQRVAVHTSVALAFNRDPTYRPLDYKEAFHLATLGGAEVLGLQDKIGNFQVGKEFDALRIHLSLGDSPVDLFSGDSVEDKIEKFLHIGDDRNIMQVYVSGRLVINRASSKAPPTRNTTPGGDYPRLDL